MKEDKKFTEYLNNIDKKYLKGRTLGLYCKYFGEEEKARQAFKEAAQEGFQFETRLPQYMYVNTKLPNGHRVSVRTEMTEEEKNKFETRIGSAESQLINGIEYDLAHVKPEYARQLFEWAAENCIIKEIELSNLIKYNNFEDVATAYLWRGYALLLLGQYSEAYKCLTQVNPYFTKGLKYGKTSKITEYKLPMALVPLCDYKLEPDDEKKQEAVKGLEDFIDGIKEIWDKEQALLYYYHLKDAFPDIYNIQPEPVIKKAKAKPSKKPGLPSSKDVIRGKIVVFDREASGSLEVFGTVNELEEYVNKVASLGDYPSLSRLLEIYGLDEQQDPGPLIEESERLLSTPGINPDIKAKTRHILNVARDAKNDGSTVMLYLDENL
jgi:tetratricopeptide (TPR) repeat protein